MPSLGVVELYLIIFLLIVVLFVNTDAAFRYPATWSCRCFAIGYGWIQEESMNITYKPIGYFRTPFTEVKGMPIQPIGALGIEGAIDVLPEYSEGLKDLEGFSHVYVLYHLHQINGYELIVKPFLDTNQHGIFATRSPKRPNPIGLSVMRLKGVSGNSVLLECVDVLDRPMPRITAVMNVLQHEASGASRFGCCCCLWFSLFFRPAQSARLRGDVLIMLFLLLLCFILLFAIEVVFGSSSGVHNAELGFDPKCIKFSRLSTRHFFMQLLPILLCIAGLLFLMARFF
jgi:tRNA (adenine37-N6)-methyltransferase